MDVRWIKENPKGAVILLWGDWMRLRSWPGLGPGRLDAWLGLASTENKKLLVVSFESERKNPPELETACHATTKKKN